jgi:hypothetical protein
MPVSYVHLPRAARREGRLREKPLTGALGREIHQPDT